MESLVNYMLVYNVCGNREPAWPKSVYLYKASLDDVYHFGPIWDFDWGFTYDDGVEGKSPNLPLMDLSSWEKRGALFFIQLFSRPEFRTLYREKLDNFKQTLLPTLLEYMDEYADEIEPSAIENGVVWAPEAGRTEGSFNFRENVKTLKQWIIDRVEYISNHENFGLYD